MSGILRLETNIPEVLTLAFPTGKLIESQMGRPADYMYTLDDGRRVFLPPKAKDVLESARVRAHQPFEIVKKKVGREIEFQIRLLAESTAATAPSAFAGAAPTTTEAAPAATTTTHTQNNPAPVAPVAASDASRRMMGCFLVALDAVHQAQEYARNKGIGITFTSDNVTSAALSCYINACREGR